GGGHRRGALPPCPHPSFCRAPPRQWAFFRLTLGLRPSLFADLHPPSRRVADYPAMALITSWRLPRRPPQNQKWVLSTDEVFLRDTAHGFLAWALATVLVAVFATSSSSSAVGTATQAVSNAIGGAASGAAQALANQSSISTDYFLDTLFRRDQPDPIAS